MIKFDEALSALADDQNYMFWDVRGRPLALNREIHVTNCAHCCRYLNRLKKEDRYYGELNLLIGLQLAWSYHVVYSGLGKVLNVFSSIDMSWLESNGFRGSSPVVAIKSGRIPGRKIGGAKIMRGALAGVIGNYGIHIDNTIFYRKKWFDCAVEHQWLFVDLSSWVQINRSVSFGKVDSIIARPGGGCPGNQGG